MLITGARLGMRGIGWLRVVGSVNFLESRGRCCPCEGAGTFEVTGLHCVVAPM
jgi:hypothetical protein